MADATYDLTTPVGMVRLLINDTDVDSEPGPVFTDAELTAFLTLNRESPKRAAAAALETIAADEALTSKVIRDHELSTDGTKLSAELRALAVSLREQADNGDDDEDGDGGSFFDVVSLTDTTCYPYSY